MHVRFRLYDILRVNTQFVNSDCKYTRHCSPLTLARGDSYSDSPNDERRLKPKTANPFASEALVKLVTKVIEH